jgi:hypothetical protein
MLYLYGEVRTFEPTARCRVGHFEMSPFMDIIGRDSEQNTMEPKNAGLLVALTATLAVFIGIHAIDAPMTWGMAPAFAQTDNSTTQTNEDEKTSNLLRKILDSSEGVAKSKMAQVETMGIPVPSEATGYYSLALAEKTSALNFLDRSDLTSAKAHTLTAMKLFKQLTDLVTDASNRQGLPSFSDNSNVRSIDQRLSELQSISAHLRAIVVTNNLSPFTEDYFAECSDAMALANLAVFQSNLNAADVQIATCETSIDAIQQAIQSKGNEADHSKRAKSFAIDAAKRVEELITKARELGVSETDLIAMDSEWHAILDLLENAGDVEYVIQLANDLKDKESKVIVLIKKIKGEPIDDGSIITKPDDNGTGSTGGGANDEEPKDPNPSSNLEDKYLHLKSEISSLKSKAYEVGIPFPSTDTDEMLDSIKQHIENDETDLAGQGLAELDEYLDTIHEVIESYSSTKGEITAATETAESLAAQVTELSYMQFMTEIDASLGLLSDANSALANLASVDNLSYSSINSAHVHIDVANDLVLQANSKLEEIQASLDEFIARVADTLALIEEEESRADEIEAEIPNVISALVNDLLDTLDQARGLLADARVSLNAGELDQALVQLDEASSLLDTAEELLDNLLDLPLL